MRCAICRARLGLPDLEPNGEPKFGVPTNAGPQPVCSTCADKMQRFASGQGCGCTGTRR